MIKQNGSSNPFEDYLSNWNISSSRGENKRYLQPPPRNPALLSMKYWLFNKDPYVMVYDEINLT